MLPEFLVGVCVALLLILVFSGVLLGVFTTKVSWFELALSAFSGLSIFIILNYFLWYFVSWTVGLAIVGSVLLIASGYGWWRVRKQLALSFDQYFLVLLGITAVFSFWLFKFTYHNGLHDEYFHYAALQLFTHTGEYPFINPYSFTQSLNETYHVGSYFIVLLVDLAPTISLEAALDIAKLVIFLPFPLFLGYALKKIVVTAPSPLLVFTVIAVVTLGPSWWFFDTYTQWLTAGRDLPQIYMTLLYDLAGITWSGLLFWIVLTLSLVIAVSQKMSKVVPVWIAVLLLFIATIFINKAYMLTSLISVLVIIGYALISKVKVIEKYIHFLIPILLGAVAVITFFFSQYSLPQLVRQPGEWGFPYASLVLSDGIQVQHSFLVWNDQQFFPTVGVAPLLIIALCILLSIQFKKLSASTKKIAVLFVVFAFCLPVGVYIVSDSGLGLALNKLLRPAYFFVAFIPLLLYEMKHRALLYISIVVFTIGMISPLRFFVVNVGEGLQQYWLTSSSTTQEVTAFLDQQHYAKILVPEWGYAYTFSNLLPIQSYACSPCTETTAPALVLPNSEGYTRQYSNQNTIFENTDFVVKELR